MKTHDEPEYVDDIAFQTREIMSGLPLFPIAPAPDHEWLRQFTGYKTFY